jgi:hypothetical protein
VQYPIQALEGRFETLAQYEHAAVFNSVDSTLDLCDLSFIDEQPGLYDSPQLVCSQTRTLHLRKGYPGAGAFQVKGANQC